METQIGVIKYDENKQPYQVLFTVKGDKTGETYEVYQKFFGDFGVFLREKEPEAGASITQAAVTAAAQRQAAAQPARAASAQELMLAFLDEDDFHKKGKILDEIAERGDINNLLIDNLAAALDVVIEDGSVESRFEQLRTCVRTRSRFENTRLR